MSFTGKSIDFNGHAKNNKLVVLILENVTYSLSFLKEWFLIFFLDPDELRLINFLKSVRQIHHLDIGWYFAFKNDILLFIDRWNSMGNCCHFLSDNNIEYLDGQFVEHLSRMSVFHDAWNSSTNYPRKPIHRKKITERTNRRHQKITVNNSVDLGHSRIETMGQITKLLRGEVSKKYYQQLWEKWLTTSALLYRNLKNFFLF